MSARRLNRTYWSVLLRRVRYFYLKLLLIPDTPHKVALGFAIGIFIGLLPIIPLQTTISVILSFIFRCSKVASAIGALITNPLTIPFMYPIFYYIGKLVTPFGHGGGLPVGWDIRDMMEVGLDAVLAGIVGGAILGVVCAPLSYWLVKKYIGRLQAWERRKLRERFGLASPNTY